MKTEVPKLGSHLKKPTVKLERQTDHTKSGKEKREIPVNCWKTNEPQATLYFWMSVIILTSRLSSAKSPNQINRVKDCAGPTRRTEWNRKDSNNSTRPQNERGRRVRNLSLLFFLCKCKADGRKDESVPHFVDPSIHTLTIELMDRPPLSTTDQGTRPFSSSLWVHLKSLYLDRRGKVLDWWWLCGTCGWVVNFPLLDPIHLFSLPIGNLLLQIVWMDLLHSGRPLNRMGLAEFISPSQVMGRMGCAVKTTAPHTTHNDICFLFTQHLYILGHLFISFHFISGANSWKRYSLKARNERNIFKAKCLFSFTPWVLFTTSCYYTGNILSFKRRFIYFSSEFTVHWKK